MLWLQQITKVISKWDAEGAPQNSHFECMPWLWLPICWQDMVYSLLFCMKQKPWSGQNIFNNQMQLFWQYFLWCLLEIPLQKRSSSPKTLGSVSLKWLLILKQILFLKETKPIKTILRIIWSCYWHAEIFWLNWNTFLEFSLLVSLSHTVNKWK